MNNDFVNISGAIGLTILKKNDTIVYIFYDDHSNVKYCKGNFLNDIVEKFIYKNKNTCLLLEEPFTDNFNNIKFLWNNKHVNSFRKFYIKVMEKCTLEKICYAFPIDLRLELFDLSIEELISNINNDEYFKDYDKTIENYFENINYLFDITVLPPVLQKRTSILIFIKKIFILYEKNFHYKILKNKIKFFFDKFINLNKKEKIKNFLRKNYSNNFYYEEGYPFNNKNEISFSDELDKIISAIMEFYCIILINILKQKYKMLYMGYYHSNNIKYILLKYYNFKEIYSTGITNNVENDNYENCINVDSKYLYNL